ncbi:MAG TPA: PEGA domain-containing protein, partial [Solirubrobacteraceae bacterium]
RQERAARERAQREREQRERDEGEREERERAAAAAMAAAPQPDAGGWLVPPERAASFEPVVPEAPLPPPTARAYPIYEPPPDPPSWSADTVPSPAEPQFEIAPVAGGRQTAPAGPLDIPAGPRAKTEPIKIKTDSYAPVFETPARADLRHEPEDMSAAGAYEPFGYTKERPPVPWKLIAAGIVLIAITFGATRWYAPIEGPIVETAKKVASRVQPKPATAPPVVSALTGQIVVKTDPSGLKVLLDGKVAGDSPLTIDNVAPGRHVITLVGSGGLLKRTVKVDSAKEVLLDVPIFAGFASIAAPFVVQVTESGKVIGTSENEIILGPGRHDLVLSNADLAYTATQSVEIQPGEATRVKIDPRGRANINALPWAEVWVDGEKAGETPLGNLPIRLGVREIVFKNPQFPDRRIVTTIKADAPATITVDFNKDK